MRNETANNELQSHPVLVDGLTGYYRNYLHNELGILTKEACLPKGNEEDYTEKLLLLHSDALAEEYKRGEFQYFYANGGNGCRPTSLGTKVFGFFVSDGEKRNSLVATSSASQIPNKFPIG